MNCVSSLLLTVIAVTSVLVGSGVAEEQYVSICEGETITLSCNYSGNFTNITWNFERLNVTEELRECVNTTCDYNLTDATRNDSGLYNCSADGMVVNSYNVAIATPPTDAPVCSVNVSSMSGNGGGVVYVREDDNMTLDCSVDDPSSWTIGWSYRDNGNTTTIGDITTDMSPVTYFIGDVDVDEDGRVYTCEAVYNDTCPLTCTVGPIYVITEDNFMIERGNETVYVGDNVTLECVTKLNGTVARWINKNGSVLIIENISGVNDTEFTCELFSMDVSNVVLDTRVVMITVVDPTTFSMTSSPNTASTPAESTGSDITTDAVTDRSTTNVTKVPTNKAPLNVAAVAGGAAGGAVALLIIIVIIIIVCRSKAKSETDGEGVKRRPKKSKEGSKKHRSGILSYRHKQPLFSTPYADDDDDAEKAGHTAPADTDVDTMITEYRPKSKIASQIRVDLDVDNGGEGTVENGFAPTQLATADEDEGPYSMGLVEGRLGIMGPGTFAAANTDSDKLVDSANQNQNNDDETETAMDDQYTKVYKPNNPGDMSFDNMTYGPIEGVDDVKKELSNDEEQGADLLQSQEDTHSDTNETDNVDDVDSPNGGGDVDRVGDEGGNENKSGKVEQKDTDITEQNHTADRESTAYAEIP